MFWFGSLIADVLYLIIFLSVSIITFFYYRFLYWQQKQIPYLPPSFPFGNIKSLALSRENFGSALCNFYNQFRERGCKYGGFYMFSTPALIITDPELIKAVLTRDFKNFHDRTVFADAELEPLIGNLFNISGSKWRTLRKKTTPTFTSGKMKKMFGTLLDTADELTAVLENNVEDSVDIKELLSKYTIDVIASCVFGLEIHALQGHNTEFRHYGKMFLQSMLGNNFNISLGMSYYRWLQKLRIRQLKPEIADFFVNLLETTIKEREKHNIQRNDFVDMYIKMKKYGTLEDEDNKENGTIQINENDLLTFNEFAAQAFLFFIAGYETSAQTITFCLYELAKNKQIQDKLREEIVSNLDKNGGKLNYNSVFEMEYLDLVVKETLRKYPSADSFNRKCVEPYEVPNTNLVIEKETPVWISVRGLHKDPEYFPDPEKFDPERFRPDEVSKRHPFTYLPFGEGPRVCIGSRFALLLVKTGVIVLLRKFKFTLDPKTKSPLEFSNQGFLLSTKDVYLKAEKVK